MDEQTGTFVVVNADDETAELRDAETGQTLALQSNPGVEAGDAIEATVAPAGAMGVAYEVVELAEQRALEVGRSREPPTGQAESVAADQPVGELTRIERAGEGELHVITVPAGEAEDAVADVLADETGLLARAARLGVRRVEVRATDDVDRPDEQVGAVSVRYLP